MLKRFLGNKSLVTLIAGIACFAIVVYFYHYRVNKIIDTIEVPVAIKRIDGRQEITKKDIKKVKVARSLLSKNVITNEQSLIGKYVDYNTFVPENGLFYDSAVVEWSEMPDSTWSDIEEGKTIVYLDIQEGSSYGNAIFPKDRIDLYIRTKDDETGKLVYAKFIESIKVLAVKDANGNHIFEKSPSTARPAQLIFEVDEEKFLLLRSVSLLGGRFEIVPVPRNANYTKKDGETLYANDWFVREIHRFSNILEPDLISDEDAGGNINIKD